MKLFCICRGPEGSNRFMIECSLCQEWFHGSCVGISKKDRNEVKNVDWYCPPCTKKQESTIPTHNNEIQWIKEKFGMVIQELRDQKGQLINLVEVVNDLKEKSPQNEEILKLLQAKDQEIQSLKSHVSRMQLQIENTASENEEYLKSIKDMEIAAQNLEKEIENGKRQIKKLKSQLEAASSDNVRKIDKASTPKPVLSLSQSCGVTKKKSLSLKKKVSSQPAQCLNMDKYDIADANDFKYIK